MAASDAYEAGRAAYAAGEPSGFPFARYASPGDPVGTWTEFAREWSRGWHAANIETALPDTDPKADQ